MTIPEAPDNKRELRSRIRRQLRDQPPGPCRARDALDQRLSRIDRDLTIATFAAIPGECDLASLVTRYPQHRWVYPRVKGHDLTFHIVTDPGAGLQPGPHGNPEPPPNSKEVAISSIDIFLCPGLAFDAAGGRLGRGGGYYDRALAKAGSALKIGVCSPVQLVPDTFAGKHDIAMDEVIAIGDDHGA